MKNKQAKISTFHQLMMSKENFVSNCSCKNTCTQIHLQICKLSMHLDFALGFFRIKHTFAFDEMLSLSLMFVACNTLQEKANKEI